MRETSITVCCGGINVLSQVPGTPLENAPDVNADETIRMIATARILMPASVVRIAAGRHLTSFSDQAMCFMAGANSIFTSERNIMLTDTTPSADHATDRAMLAAMGLRARVLEPVDA